jgi:hypothetical protein
VKLDPGMHIGLHLVFFGKTGVTGFRGDDRAQRKGFLKRTRDLAGDLLGGKNADVTPL